ncbi:MAG: hypothetical protein LBK70_03700 [Clostridiales bacterium]|nr:hypothetical protein [Clostridiales bacterium]
MNEDKVALSTIASISVGLVVSRISKPPYNINQGSKRYKYLTLSSAINGWGIDESGLRDFEPVRAVDERFLTKLGDVIMGISSPHSIVLIDQSAQGGLVIPSQFVVIRLTTQDVLPEYLAIYMSSDEVQDKIAHMSKGTAVKIINAHSLQSLEIRIPVINKQKKLAKLRELLHEENKLSMQYARLVNQKNNYYLNHFVSEGAKNV